MQKKTYPFIALIKITIAIMAVYFFYCIIIFFMQRPILFPVSQIPTPKEPNFKNTTIQVRWIKTNNFNVETWYLPPRPGVSSAPHPLIIFAHGNAELIDNSFAVMAPFTRLGIGVLLVEYPGYGRSTGTPSEKSITAALTDAYDMMVKRSDIDKNRIVLFGRSLGGGAICQLAARRKSAAMILVSTFTRVGALASGFLIPEFMIRDPFDDLAVVRAYPEPILIMHGKYDSIVPYNQGLKLYQAARKGTMITYACGHNDLPPNRKQYMKDIANFLKRNGII